MNLFTKHTQTHRHNKINLLLPKGKGGVGGLGKTWRDKLGVWD